MELYSCIVEANSTGLEIGTYWNYNAINVNVFGGNFLGNAEGIHTDFGPLGKVDGVLFENGNGWDIVSNASSCTTIVSGCTSESTNFCLFNYAQPTLVGNNQRSVVPGYFLISAYGGVIDSCFSALGQVLFQTIGHIRNSQFNRPDAITSDANYMRTGVVELENVLVGGSIGTGYNTPNYVRGQIFNGPSAQYFIGRKGIPIKNDGVTLLPGATLYRVADLPPASDFRVSGATVTVFDALNPAVGQPVAGGGAVPALVFSNGSAWKVVSA
jgi:hypothetical protein